MKIPIKIIKFIFYYFDGKPIQESKSLCEVKAQSTLVDWSHFIRERTHDYICEDKIGGPEKVVQIDESLMRGRRKNNKGRYLLGDVIDLDPISNSRRMNYGEREDGPWVFGMIESGSRKMKLFYVPDRKESTLLPILLAHVHPETEIWSDEWKGYVNLGNYFRRHRTVKHKENFINPETGLNTQLIECVRSHAKLNLLRLKRRTNITLLQSHLSFFTLFIDLMKVIHSISLWN